MRVEDYLTGLAILADGSTEQILLRRENVLKFILADGSWVAIRPSGTEPKCKFYFGVKGDSLETSNQKLEKLMRVFH